MGEYKNNKYDQDTEDTINMANLFLTEFDKLNKADETYVMHKPMTEAIKEINKAKFEKAKIQEFCIVTINPRVETDLLSLQIDLALEEKDFQKVERLNTKLQSVKSFLKLGGK